MSLLADDRVAGEEADWHQQNRSSYPLDDQALPLQRSGFDEYSEVLLVPQSFQISLSNQLSTGFPAMLFPNPHYLAKWLAGAHGLVTVAYLTISSFSVMNTAHCSKFCPWGEIFFQHVLKRYPRLGHSEVAVLCWWCPHVVQNHLSKQVFLCSVDWLQGTHPEVTDFGLE